VHGTEWHGGKSYPLQSRSLAATAVTATSAATGGGGGGLLEALLIGAGAELGMPARVHQEPAQRRRNVHRSRLISSPQTVVVAPTPATASIRTTTYEQIRHDCSS